MADKDSRNQDKPHAAQASAHEPTANAQPHPFQIPEVSPKPTVPNPSDVIPAGTHFERFTITEPLTVPERDPAGALVTRTGRSTTNANGAQLLRALALKQGLDPENFALEYGVALAEKRVSLYPVDRQKAGVAAILQDSTRNEIVFHLGPIFRKHPALGPDVRKQCDMALTVDAKGVECVALALGTGVTKPVRRRTGTKSQTQNQEQNAQEKPNE